MQRWFRPAVQPKEDRMKRIFIILICISILINCGTVNNCYSEVEYSDFVKKTNFIVEEIDVSYTCDDIIDYKVFSCNRNGIVVSAEKQNRDSKYIFINYSGDVVECNDISNDMPLTFNNGTAGIRCDNGKFGSINEEYQWVLPPIYDYATGFSDGYAVIKMPGNDKFELINNEGKSCLAADGFFQSDFDISSSDKVFSNSYAAYKSDGIVYYLDNNLKSVEINAGDMSNYKYYEYYYNGGTLVLAYYTELENKVNYIGYKVLDHNGNVSYEHKVEMPIEKLNSLSEFLTILPNGTVIFEKPKSLEDYEVDSTHISVSSSGKVFGNTTEIHTNTPHKELWGIDDKVVNFSNIYDLALNNICKIDWLSNRDYSFFSDDGDVFGDLIVSKSDDKSSAAIEKIRLIRGCNAQLNRNGKLVDLAKVPMFELNEDTDKVSVYINNERIDFTSEPIIENDRTLVPMRGIFEELDAIVTWDNDTNTATAVKDNTEIKISIDSDTMLKNGEAIKLDAPARLIDDAYTYVPLRAVSEAFGYKVIWSEELNRVDIITKI